MNPGLKAFRCKIVTPCFAIRVRGLTCYGCDLLNPLTFLIPIRESVRDVFAAIYLTHYEVFKSPKPNAHAMFFFLNQNFSLLMLS